MTELTAAEQDLQHKYDHLVESRTVMQCVRSLGQGWRLTWMQGRRRSTAANAIAPLARLIESKRGNLSKLYADGSDEQQVFAEGLADLMWRHDAIVKAEREEEL